MPNLTRREYTFNANEIFAGQTISLDINAPVGMPEPSSLMMLGFGLLGLAGLALKKSA